MCLLNYSSNKKEFILSEKLFCRDFSYLQQKLKLRINILNKSVFFEQNYCT